MLYNWIYVKSCNCFLPCKALIQHDFFLWHFLEKCRKIANPEGGFHATHNLSQGTAKKCARPIAHHSSFQRMATTELPLQKNRSAGRITPLPCAAFLAAACGIWPDTEYNCSCSIQSGCRNLCLDRNNEMQLVQGWQEEV
jgi:hypothetical protein